MTTTTTAASTSTLVLRTGRKIRCRHCISSPCRRLSCQSAPSTVASTHRSVGVGRVQGATRRRAEWASRGTSGPPSFVVARRQRRRSSSFVFSSLRGLPPPPACSMTHCCCCCGDCDRAGRKLMPSVPRSLTGDVGPTRRQATSPFFLRCRLPWQEEEEGGGVVVEHDGPAPCVRIGG